MNVVAPGPFCSCARASVPIVCFGWVRLCDALGHKTHARRWLIMGRMGGRHVFRISTAFFASCDVLCFLACYWHIGLVGLEMLV